MSNQHINAYYQKKLMKKLNNEINSTMLKSGSLNYNPNPKNQEELEKVKKSKIESFEVTKIRVYKNLSTSGRTFLWKSIVERYDKNKLFGYGPQADRFLLGEGLEKFHGYGNNVSNGILYAFACSGYFGFFLIILIYIIIFYFIYDKFFIEKIFQNNNNFFEKIALYFAIFFLIRSGFENSFLYFGIDFLILIASIGTLKNDSYVKLFLKSK
jgi:O-antigen ligase